MLEGTLQGVLWPNLVSFYPVVLEKKTLKDFQLFNQSEAMSAILCIGQGHLTEFWKRTTQGEPHPSLIQFDPVVLQKIKMRKVNKWWLRCRMPSDGENPLEPSRKLNDWLRWTQVLQKDIQSLLHLSNLSWYCWMNKFIFLVFESAINSQSF